MQTLFVCTPRSLYSVVDSEHYLACHIAGPLAKEVLDERDVPKGVPAGGERRVGTRGVVQRTITGLAGYRNTSYGAHGDDG